ncbi:extracellular solute-binding protein [Eubacteriales bacterium mix99]
MRKSGFQKAAGLLLSLCVMVSLASGCTSSGQGKKQNDKKENSVSASTSSDSRGKGASEAKKKVKIDLVMGDNVVMPEEKDNFINQELDKALHVDLTMSILGGGTDYATALNTRISSGDVPDMFYVPSQQSFQQYADSGLLMSLTPYLDKIQPVVDWAGGKESLTPNTYKGELYRVPKKPGIDNYKIWSIRKDWLDAVKAQIPTTPEEALDVAKRFTFEDPDGNGKKDTYGFAGPGINTFDAIVNSYGGSLKSDIIIKDNEVMASILQPDMKAALEMCKSFVDGGVVDPDLVADDNNSVRDKLIQGMSGMTFYTWAGLYKQIYMDQVLAVNPKAEWVCFNGLEGPHGHKNGTSDIDNVAGRWVISKEIESDEVKRDRIFDLLNYTVSGEGLNLLCYGVEGRHFNIEDGKVVPTELMSRECDYIYVYQICNRDDLTYCETKFPEAKTAIETGFHMDRYHTYNGEVDLPEGLHKSDMDNYISDNMIKFIYGKRPINEYDDFIKELSDSFQFDEYLKAAQTQLKEKEYIK